MQYAMSCISYDKLMQCNIQEHIIVFKAYLISFSKAPLLHWEGGQALEQAVMSPNI